MIPSQQEDQATTVQPPGSTGKDAHHKKNTKLLSNSLHIVRYQEEEGHHNFCVKEFSFLATQFLRD